LKFNVNDVKVHRWGTFLKYAEKDFDVTLGHESKKDVGN